jgi:hypothetical protein
MRGEFVIAALRLRACLMPQPERPPRASQQARLERSQFEPELLTLDCKTDRIRAAWAAGDRIGALRIAARFFDRSEQTKAFKRGMAAHNNPSFYRQLGKDPGQIVADALALLARRFSLR